LPDSSQYRAVKDYRRRLKQRGVARFEVVGRKDDQELIRALARQLAEGGADATRLRAEVSQSLAGRQGNKGGIWAALRRSPLVGADVKFERPRVRERKVDL
jgi:hypothetical protein